MPVKKRDPESPRKLAAVTAGEPIRTEAACPVVVLGASAGGLPSFEQFFRALPSDHPIAYVVITHTDPNRQSLLPELIAKYTAMPVVSAANGLAIEPGQVYVCPHDHGLEIVDGAFALTPQQDRAGPRTVIDHFMRSLAESHHGNAIGIVLSGTGSDGSQGLAAIKHAGGMTMAESPETAIQSGMPLSAIRTRSVDLVLSPEEMPAHLLGYVRHAGDVEARAEQPGEAGNAADLNSILSILHARKRHDFRAYKRGTITRRIARRMGLLHIEDLAAYVPYLRKHPGEVAKLFDDLLIGATRFFREPEAYQALDHEAITRLLREKTEGEPLRVWVAGCATGEEAYSLAMLLSERLQAEDQHRVLQLFATDIDETALSFARAAVYPDGIAADVSPERLRRWFVKEDRGYRVTKPIRESVVFATQNLLSDPPFSKLDLISCRNLLIYIEPEAQKRAIALFNFALRQGGYLLLGNSETIGQAQDLFLPISKKWRIYQRIGIPARSTAVFPSPRTGISVRETEPPAARQPQRTHPATLAEAMQAQVLGDYAPACVVITTRYKTLHFLGPTGDYLEQPGGAPTQDLLNMARKGLRTKLRSAIERVIAGATVSTSNVELSRDGRRQSIRIVVRQMHLSQGDEELLLVAFLEKSNTPSKKEAGDHADDLLLGQLEHELKATRQDLQGTIEELESANEELKTANEEAMSMNEELQSSNEELETSKEELQSLNEELSTVNNELQLKIEEVETANNDLSNLLNGTDMATVFLDGEGRIRRFTPATVKLFSLIASDLGRPISDISHRFVVNDLREAAETVIQTLIRHEAEVATVDSRWFIRRIMPYRTQDQRIEGVVVTFSEITTIKDIEQNLKISDARLRVLYEDNPSMFFSIDAKGLIRSVNRFGAEQLGYSALTLEGSSFFDLHETDRGGMLQERVQNCLSAPSQVHRWEAQLKARDGSLIWARETARAALMDGDDGIFIVCENISEEKKLSSEMFYRANHDSMTGLVNRRRFDELLAGASQAAIDKGEVHALLFLDLDQFKVVNDTVGHLAGDEMLRQIAQLLLRVSGRKEFVGRLGGDEFAILLENCDPEESRRFAHRLLTAIKEFRFIWEGQSLRASASIGLVTIDEESGGVADILRSADIACYKVKEGGRGDVEHFVEADEGLLRIRNDMKWVQRIHDAMEHHLLQLYGQMIVPIKPQAAADAALHFEVLIRLVEADGLVINAYEFIPAIERYSLGSTVDRWVLATTLRTLAQNPEQMARVGTCTINLSAQSLVKGDFAEFAVAEIERTRVPPRKICFELTETAAITNLPQAQKFIATLRALGCRFSLDDFGSGLSSFQYLKVLEVDYVKIDGHFIRNMLDEPRELAIVNSINEIAHAMGKLTIAESVENAETRDKVRELGVDYVQGVAMGVQMPLQELLSGQGAMTTDEV